MPKVQIVTGEQRRKAVKSAVDALGHDFMNRVKAAGSIFIKPDLVHHSLQLASTHVDAVRGILDLIRMYSDVPVAIGDAAQYGAKEAFKNFGYDDLPFEYKNVRLLDLHDDEYVETQITKADGTVLVVRRARSAIEADFKISVSPMKTHYAYGASMTVAGWAEGTWLVPPRMTAEGKVWSRAPWLDALSPEDLHVTIAELYLRYPCDVGVIDGILAMEGDGPIRGTPIHMGVVIAGMDAVATDTIGATLMGMDPHAIRYLEVCAEKGGGVNEISEIDDVPLHQLHELTKQFKN